MENPITREYQIISVSGDALTSRMVHVCTEDNITIHLNGHPLTTLKITPDDFPAFAVGFVIDEGLVADLSLIREVKIDLPDIMVTTRESPLCDKRFPIEIRSAGVGISTPAGCQGKPLGPGISIPVDTLFAGTILVHQTSSVWKATGGTHCTAILDEQGRLVSAAEDIGRHNSLDKAVGKALLAGRDLSQCFMVCTGRLPADMVAKAYRAGITIMVSNNAPFSSGIELAERMNMTLAGFARPPKVSIYSHPGRILLHEPDYRERMQQGCE